MKKRALIINEKAIDDNLLSLLNELQQMGYARSDGFLYYEDSDKEAISTIFAKYGKTFLE